MKKFLIAFVAVLFVALQANAQRIGYIDTEKILSAIPAYKSAQQQLESLGNQYQSVIEAEYAKIETLYNKYQQQKANLTAQARQAKENEIIQKEQAVKEKQKEYFGAEGTMQQYSEQLMGPIMEKVDAAVSQVAKAGNYMIIMDVASMQGIAYKNQAYDLSNEVLRVLGY